MTTLWGQICKASTPNQHQFTQLTISKIVAKVTHKYKGFSPKEDEKENEFFDHVEK